MTERGFTESVVEQAALAWLESAGWQVAHGPDIAPLTDRQAGDLPCAERASYAEVVLARRLRDVLARVDPDLSAEVLEGPSASSPTSKVPLAPPCPTTSRNPS